MIANLFQALGYDAKRLSGVDVLLDSRDSGASEQCVVKLILVTVYTLRAYGRTLLVHLITWLITEPQMRLRHEQHLAQGVGAYGHGHQDHNYQHCSKHQAEYVTSDH